MTSQTLRELAREYAKGTLDRESYRRDRAALIDGILSGAVPVAPIEYAAPVSSRSSLDMTHPGKRRKKDPAESDVDELDFFDITQVVPEHSDSTQVVTPSSDITPPRPERSPVQDNGSTAEPRPFNYTPFMAAIGVGILLLLVIAVALLARPGDRETSANATAPADAAAPARTGTETTPAAVEGQVAMTAAGSTAADAILEFLRAKNWSDESMAQFNTSWQSLPRDEREAAAGSAEMLQLANAVYRKLLELRALSQVNEDAASAARQTRLLEFARNLGITDSRLNPDTAGAAPGPG